MYGNDCSGFVSIAWGIERTDTDTFIKGMGKGRFKKVGNYNSSSPSSTELLAAYKVMQPGDALVKEGAYNACCICRCFGSVSNSV